MVAMVKWLSQRFVVPLVRVQFPLATPRKNLPEAEGFLVPRAGIEPATLGLEVPCSIQLSYRGVNGRIDHDQRTLETYVRKAAPSICSIRR
jgi:hypothetical protein